MKIVNGKTFSVWEFLNSPRFRNHLYASPGNSCGSKVSRAENRRRRRFP
jgi:hypothetical protein